MDEPSSPGGAGRDLTTVLTTVLTALVVLVVVVMGAVASAKGWIPTGDDAFLSLRTRHLIARHPILLNNASSAGPSAGSQYNHPGAFPLTLLAPITFFGGPGSLALATATVNAAWIALISVMVRRIAGATAQLGALLVLALTVWSMGATFLVDPWNPNDGILPVAAMVVAAWGARQGHTRLLAVTVFAASVAFQTHLSLTVISVAVAGWALFAAFRDWYAAGAAEHDALDLERGRIARALGYSVIAGVVANAQMLVDQLFDSGNLSKILEGTGFKEATVSVRQVAGVLASKVIVPPMWFRGSWAGPVLPADELSTATIVIGLVAIVVITLAAVWWARGNVPGLSSLFGVLTVAFVSATAISTRFPLRIGIPLPYFRWVWPLAAIWLAAVLAAAGNAIAPVLRRRFVAADTNPRHGTGGAAPVGLAVWGTSVAIAVIALVAFVPTNEDISPNPEWAQDLSREFSAAAVRETKDLDFVVVDQSIQEAALWVIPALMDQLDAAGIDVRASDPVLIQQTHRTFARGGGERWHLAVRGGLQIDDAPDDATEIARHDALTPGERRELERLVAELTPALEAENSIGVVYGFGDEPGLDLFTDGDLPPDELLRSVPFRSALERGAVSVDGVDRDDLMRATELGARDGGRSIALYLVDTRPDAG